MIKFVKSWIPAFLFFTWINSSHAQQSSYNPVKKFSVAELKEDFSVFRDKFEKHHPNLYLYSSKKTVDSAFDHLYHSINSEMTDMEFYRVLNQMHIIIKDGHSMILPGKEALEFINSKAGLLPLTLRTNGDQLFCIRNCSPGSTIKDGDQIKSINGVLAKNIIDTLRMLQLRDGYNETYPRWITNQFFRAYYYFIFGQHDEFAIVLQQNGTEKMHRIKAMTADSIRLYNAMRYQGADNPANSKGIQLSINNQPLAAILTIKSFDNITYRKKFHQHYRKEIRKSFKLIRNNHIGHLVVDIRGNQGGNPIYVKQLLSRIMPNCYHMALEARVVKNSSTASWIERNRKKYFPWYGLGMHHPKKNAFTGKLYILIDGGTFSASGQFASVIEKYNRGVFIGEEAGGNKAIIGGFFLPKKSILPNTKIEISPARLLTLYREAGANTGHGVVPAYPVFPSIEDMIENKDPVKEFAFRLIGIVEKN